MPIRRLRLAAIAAAALSLPLLVPALAAAEGAPTVAFAAPLAPTNTKAASVTIHATASDAGGHVAKVVFKVLKLGVGPIVEDVGQDQASYSATIDISGLSDGAYSLVAQAVDDLGNSSQVSTTLIIDRTPPLLMLTQGPAEGEVIDPDVAFAWEADDPIPASGPLTVTCAWDGESQVSCGTSQLARTDLPNGAHTFTIIAADALGNRTTLVRRFLVTGNSSGTSVPKVRCRVPRLKGLSLIKAKARIRAAGCTLGTVKRLKNPSRRALVVKTQSRRAGAKYITRARINLVLGPKA